MHLHVPYPDPWADRNQRNRRQPRRRRRGSDETGYEVPDTEREPTPPTYH